MKVFKFGGASVKDAEAVKNVAQILSSYSSEKICVVVSAMGKTTNALEAVTNSYFHKKNDAFELLKQSKQFHYQILDGLFGSKKHPIYDVVNNFFVEIEWAIEDEPTGTYDFEYDQIVSVGELISTSIVSAYLKEQGLTSKWFDARDIIKTDNTYREGLVDWKQTEQFAQQFIGNYFSKNNSGIAVTQGFIGVTSENFTTTLGREGSDYSAGILAYCLNAKSMTIWKDVPGMLNADPKWFSKTELLSHISYREAIELAYYGASVIHPKTIKPLQNKQIPLCVKSFVNPVEIGTLIDKETGKDSLIPSFIFKMEQTLISISPKDFSFIVEENLQHIFGLFSKHRVKINLMQNSALYFSASVDNNERLPLLLQDLEANYKVLRNEELELVTIRHYNEETITRVTTDKKIYLRQLSRTTARFVMSETK